MRAAQSKNCYSELRQVAAEFNWNRREREEGIWFEFYNLRATFLILARPNEKSEWWIIRVWKKNTCGNDDSQQLQLEQSSRTTEAWAGAEPTLRPVSLQAEAGQTQTELKMKNKNGEASQPEPGQDENNRALSKRGAFNPVASRTTGWSSSHDMEAGVRARSVLSSSFSKKSRPAHFLSWAENSSGMQRI